MSGGETDSPTARGGPGIDHVEFLFCRIGNERCALELGLVDRVAPLSEPDVTRVPRTPAIVRGVTSVEGSVSVVLDLRPEADIGGEETSIEGRLVCLDLLEDGEGIGLFVEDTEGLESTHVDSIRQPGETDQGLISAPSIGSGNATGNQDAGAGPDDSDTWLWKAVLDSETEKEGSPVPVIDAGRLVGAVRDYVDRTD